MQHQPEQITSALSITSGVGTATAAVGFNINELAIWVGMIFTVLTFLMSLFFHIRRDRRERRAAEDLHLSRLRQEGSKRTVRTSHDYKA